MNKSYWNDYHKFWDGFVRNWFKSGAKPQDEVTRRYCAIAAVNLDELPDPYLGTPEAGVDAVFLNLNPGRSVIGKYGAFRGKNLEATKAINDWGKA